MLGMGSGFGAPGEEGSFGGFGGQGVWEKWLEKQGKAERWADDTDDETGVEAEELLGDLEVWVQEVRLELEAEIEKERKEIGGEKGDEEAIKMKKGGGVEKMKMKGPIWMAMGRNGRR